MENIGCNGNLLKFFSNKMKESEVLVEEWKKQGMPGGLGALESQVIALSAAVERVWLKELLDKCGDGYVGTYINCKKCDKPAKYKYRSRKRIKTMLGEQEKERAYYYCYRCGEGFCPLDEDFHVESQEASPCLRKIITELGADIPFERVAKYVWDTRRVAISGDSALRYTHKVGETVEKWMKACHCQEMDQAQEDCNNVKKLLYTSADATSVNIRGEGWKQPKVAVVYESDDGGRMLKKRYTAGFWDKDVFANRWWKTGTELATGRQAQWVSVNDGADWIWKLVNEKFPDAVEIVDWYHAKERLYTIGKLVFGEESQNAKVWCRKAETMLWKGKVYDVIEEIKQLKPKGKQAKDYVRQSKGYYATHARRMKYPQYRKAGYNIGSGPIEGGGCKNVVGDRFKRTGMRWTKPGAHRVLQVRSAMLDGSLTSFWQQMYAIN